MACAALDPPLPAASNSADNLLLRVVADTLADRSPLRVDEVVERHGIGRRTTAREFVTALHEARCPAELPTIEKRLGPGDEAIGILVRDLFDTAKAAIRMPLDGVESLFASPRYEVRMGALCILDFRAKAPLADEAERKWLYDLHRPRLGREGNAPARSLRRRPRSSIPLRNEPSRAARAARYQRERRLEPASGADSTVI